MDTPEPAFFTDGAHVKNVDNLKHLGSSISKDEPLEREFTTRIREPSQVPGRLCTRVLNST